VVPAGEPAVELETRTGSRPHGRDSLPGTQPYGQRTDLAIVADVHARLGRPVGSALLLPTDPAV
jgi:hypothetical protein